MSSEVVSAGPRNDAQSSTPNKVGLWPLTGYFLKLGTIGFGGPVALAHRRDVPDEKRDTSEISNVLDTEALSLLTDSSVGEARRSGAR